MDASATPSDLHQFKIASWLAKQAGLTSHPLCTSDLCSELSPEEFCVILLKIVRTQNVPWARVLPWSGWESREQQGVIDVENCWRHLCHSISSEKRGQKNSLLLPTTQSVDNCIRATCTQHLYMPIDRVKQTLQVSRNENEKSQGEVIIIAETYWHLTEAFK